MEGYGLRSPFGRVGGKSKLKKELINDFFPKDYENMIYVEVFIGGGSVFFEKEPSKKEVINDLDKDVVIVMRGLKKYNANEIEKAVRGDYDKKDFERIKASQPKDNFKKFVRQFILYRTSMMSKGDTFAYNNTLTKEPTHVMSNLEGYKDRMKNTIILNEDFKKVIKDYDSANTLFYLDPPYENSKGLYTHPDLPIKDVYEAVKNIKGKFILSYNNSPEAKDLFRKDFYIYTASTKYTSNPQTQNIKRLELIITNFKR